MPRSPPALGRTVGTRSAWQPFGQPSLYFLVGNAFASIHGLQAGFNGLKNIEVILQLLDGAVGGQLIQKHLQPLLDRLLRRGGHWQPQDRGKKRQRATLYGHILNRTSGQENWGTARRAAAFRGSAWHCRPSEWRGITALVAGRYGPRPRATPRPVGEGHLAQRSPQCDGAGEAGEPAGVCHAAVSAVQAVLGV